MLDKYVDMFAESNTLTARETEILKLLTNNITHLKEMAVHLGLSQSTINNHLNNIYMKCRVKGKAQLLAKCFGFISKQMEEPTKKFVAPRVLVVDDEIELCEILKSYLEDIGFNVSITPDSTTVMEIIEKESVDIILSDINMPKMDGFELLKNVRAKYPEYPVFMFMTGYSKYKNDELYDSGAAIIIDKPIDFNMLYYQMMQFYLEDMTEKGRLLRVHKAIECKINETKTFPISNVSMGGVFVDVPLEKLSDDLFKPGSKLRLSFIIDPKESPVNVEAKVIWKREKEINDFTTGVGVKFQNITEEDHKKIEKFVRIHKILDLVPMESNRVLGESK